MVDNRLTAWLRPVLTLFALVGILSLSACGGGGGAVAGSPYVPPDVPPTPPTLTVLPTTVTVFSGVPATLTITAGTAPFQAFSSNAAILPVTQAATTTIPLLPAQVNADTTVTITIQDASGQRVTVPVTVSPSLLLPASITITGNPVCTGSGATLCSGQDGTASVVVTGIGGATLAGRSVRYDVVLGTYSLIAANSTVPAQTLTVQSDQNGLAAVTLRVPQSALTQFATLRATDVTSGSTVIAQFTIAQFVNGNTVLSVIPTGTTTFTGPDSAHCAASGVAAFYIFGGTPPYTVQTNFPTAVNLSGVPVLASGGSFTVGPNGTCFTGLTFAITDAAGRTLLTPPTVDNVLGTAAPTVPLTIIPGEYPVGGGTTSCASGNTFAFLINGGSGKYSGSVSPGSGATGTATATVTTGTANVAFTSLSHGDWTLNVTDGTTVATGTIHCN
jgi:hypothetical protein